MKLMLQRTRPEGEIAVRRSFITPTGAGDSNHRTADPKCIRTSVVIGNSIMFRPADLAPHLLNAATGGVYRDVLDKASGTNEFSVSYVTAPNQETAEKIANALVEGRWAACVNIIPSVTSIYRWKGEVKKDQEVMLMIKSPTFNLAKMADFVKENHPYEVCEVISTLIKSGHPTYIQYLRDTLLLNKH